MYSHYYMVKKPNMSKHKDAKARLASARDEAHGAGEERRLEAGNEREEMVGNAHAQKSAAGSRFN